MAGHVHARKRFLRAAKGGFLTSADAFSEQTSPALDVQGGLHILKPAPAAYHDREGCQRLVEGPDWDAFEANHLIPALTPPQDQTVFGLGDKSLDDILEQMDPYQVRMRELSLLKARMSFDGGGSFSDIATHDYLHARALGVVKNYRRLIDEKVADIRSTQKHMIMGFTVGAALSAIIAAYGHWPGGGLHKAVLILMVMMGLIFIMHLTVRASQARRRDQANAFGGTTRETHLSAAAFLKDRKAAFEAFQRQCAEQADYSREDSWQARKPADWAHLRRRWMLMARYGQARAQAQSRVMQLYLELMAMATTGLNVRAVYKAHFIRFWLRREAATLAVGAMTVLALASAVIAAGVHDRMLGGIVLILLMGMLIYVARVLTGLEAELKMPDDPDAIFSHVGGSDGEDEVAKSLSEYLRVDALRQLREDEKRK